jgi:hypothetical protein
MHGAYNGRKNLHLPFLVRKIFRRHFGDNIVVLLVDLNFLGAISA